MQAAESEEFQMRKGEIPVEIAADSLLRLYTLIAHAIALLRPIPLLFWQFRRCLFYSLFF